MSTKTLIFPQRYVQGPNTLSQIGDHLEILGIKNPLIVGGPTALGVCRESIQQSISAKGMTCAFHTFGGETSMSEINIIKEACQSGGNDAIISCGGGKALDAGRTAAAANAINAGVVPTRGH
jgi:glycerol dehydrogenase